MWKLLPEEYHYHKGGGNGAMIAMMMQMQEQARADRAAEQERQRIAEEKATAAAAKAEEKAALEKTEKKASTGQKVQTAYDTALSQGRKRLLNKGIDPDNDPYGIMGLFSSGLDTARAGLPDIVENTAGIFSPTLLDDALTEARGTQRNRYGNSVKTSFGDDYGRTAFGDTADDAIIESVLKAQQDEAVQNLDRALARGTLNEVGRSTADKELANMRKIGLGKANSLGMNVLNDYRSQLDSAVGKVRDRANNWDFGSDFNIDKEMSGVNSLKSSLGGRLEGDILSALDGMKFFDNDILLGKGGSASGINNSPLGTSNSPLLGSTTGTTDRTKATAPDSNRKVTALDEVF